MPVVRYRDENGKIVPLRVIKGDKGDQMYVRFSAYADGTDMSEKWDSERNYMGIAFARVAPENKEAYQWISLADISLGRYAEEGSAERYLFFVGNGTDEDNRSNALTVDEKGNAWFAGDLTFGEDGYSPRDAIEAEKVDRAEHIGAVASEFDKKIDAEKVAREAQIEQVATEVGDAIARRAVVMSGSYAGTGTHGSSNPNSVTFEFVPKVVFLLRNTKESSVTYETYAGGDYQFTGLPVLFWVEGLESTHIGQGYYKVYDEKWGQYLNEYEKCYLYFNLTDTTLTWYAATEGGKSQYGLPELQRNSANTVYTFIAIG